MSGNLPIWISEHPEIINELEARPTLARILDGITYKPCEKKVEDNEWNEITKRLNM